MRFRINQTFILDRSIYFSLLKKYLVSGLYRMNRRIIAFLSCGMNKYPPVPVVSKLQNFYVKMALFCYFFSAAADGNFCLEVCSCQSGKILSTKRMTGADILTVTLLKQDGGSCQKITRSIHFQGSKLRGVLNHYKCLFICMC